VEAGGAQALVAATSCTALVPIEKKANSTHEKLSTTFFSKFLNDLKVYSFKW